MANNGNGRKHYRVAKRGAAGYERIRASVSAANNRKMKKVIIAAALFSVLMFIKGGILGYITGCKRCGL